MGFKKISDTELERTFTVKEMQDVEVKEIVTKAELEEMKTEIEALLKLFE